MRADRQVISDDRRIELAVHRSYAFVATPPAGQLTLAVGGKLLRYGDRLDNAMVTPRRLRQMHAQRLIALAPGQPPLPGAPRTRPPPVGTAPVSRAAAEPPAQPRVVPRRVRAAQAA